MNGTPECINPSINLNNSLVIAIVVIKQCINLRIDVLKQLGNRLILGINFFQVNVLVSMYFYASRAQRKQTTFTSAEVSDELVRVESTSHLWHDTFFIGLQERLVHYAMGD